MTLTSRSESMGTAIAIASSSMHHRVWEAVVRGFANCWGSKRAGGEKQATCGYAFSQLGETTEATAGSAGACVVCVCLLCLLHHLPLQSRQQH